jgi:hypothetical protein
MVTPADSPIGFAIAVIGMLGFLCAFVFAGWQVFRAGLLPVPWLVLWVPVTPTERRSRIVKFYLALAAGTLWGFGLAAIAFRYFT